MSPDTASVVGVGVGDGVTGGARVEVGVGDAVGRSDGVAVSIDCGVGDSVGRGEGFGVDVGCGAGVGVNARDQVVVGGRIGVGVGSGVWPYPMADSKGGVTVLLSSVSTATTGSATVMWNLSDALSPSESMVVVGETGALQGICGNAGDGARRGIEAQAVGQDRRKAVSEGAVAAPGAGQRRCFHVLPHGEGHVLDHGGAKDRRAIGFGCLGGNGS